MTTKLYELVKAMEEFVAKDDCNEEVYKKVLDITKSLHKEFNDLKNKVEILENESRLDLIELLLKEGVEEAEESEIELPYIVLAQQQLRKLRNPF
jgi:ferritin-like protein